MQDYVLKYYEYNSYNLKVKSSDHKYLVQDLIQFTLEI